MAALSIFKYLDGTKSDPNWTNYLIGLSSYSHGDIFVHRDKSSPENLFSKFVMLEHTM